MWSHQVPVVPVFAPLSQLRLISPSAFGVFTLGINRKYPPHYVHLFIWGRAKLAIDLNTIRTWERSGPRRSLCCLGNYLVLCPGHLCIVFPRCHFIGAKLGGVVERCSVLLPQAGWGSRPFLLVVVAATFSSSRRLFKVSREVRGLREGSRCFHCSPACVVCSGLVLTVGQCQYCQPWAFSLSWEPSPKKSLHQFQNLKGLSLVCIFEHHLLDWARGCWFLSLWVHTCN